MPTPALTTESVVAIMVAVAVGRKAVVFFRIPAKTRGFERERNGSAV
jgi:hypothetical protein